MRLTRRATTLFLFLVPVAVLAVIAGLLTARYLRAAEARSAVVLAQTLSLALGHEVTIGALHFEGAHVVATDVRLAEGRTLRTSGTIASAQRIVLKTSVRRLIDEIRSGALIHCDAEVSGARVRITRDARGVWNFADLFRPRPGARPRAVSAHMRIARSSVQFEDAALPRILHRSLPPLRASAQNVDGSLDLFPDGSVGWSANVPGSPRVLRSGRVDGGYEASTGALHVEVDVREARPTSLARYVLPASVDLMDGEVSGHVSILRTSAHDAIVTTAQLRTSNASARIARLAAPLTQVDGAARLLAGSVELDLTGRCAGARIHASGTLGLASPFPTRARFSASVPDLRPALAALSPIRRVSLPNWARVGGSIAGSLVGPLDAPHIDANGAARLAGSPSPEVRAEAPTQIDFHVAGPLNAPHVYASANAGRLRYRDTTFRRAAAVASFDGKRWTADLRARTSGGSLSARATLQNNGGAIRYRLVARARSIDLARAGIQSDRTLGGAADADLFLEGSDWTSPPDGQMIVHVSGLNYGNLALDDARAALRSDGDRLLVDSLVADGASGRIVASGEIDLTTHVADLSVEADRIDLAQLPVSLNDARSTALAGRAFLRLGSVTGPIADPSFAGVVTAIGPSIGRYRFDYAEARVEGTLHRVALRDAVLWRLPATASFDGELLEPFSGHGLVRGTGRFDNLDIQDAARLADLKLDAVGEASGDISVAGRLDAPAIALEPVSIARAGFGDVTPREVTGRVALLPDRRFEATVDVRGVDLFLPNAAISSYVLLEGEGDLHATVNGALRDGAAVDVAGRISVATHGLTISGQTLGDLAATANLEDQVLTLRSSPDGKVPGARLGTAERGIDVTNLQVNLSTGDYMLGARARGLSIDLLRAALARSPMASGSPARPADAKRPNASETTPAIQKALQVAESFSGAVDLTLHLTGNGSAPTGWLAWSGAGVSFDAAPTRQFEGRVEFAPGAATLTQAVLDTGAASLTASGSYVPGKSLSGQAILKRLPLDRLAALFPEWKGAAGLGGTADEARLSVDGPPDAPNLHLSATLTDLPITPSPETLQIKKTPETSTKPAQTEEAVRALVKRIDIDDAYLVGGKIGAHGVVATIAGGKGAVTDYTFSAAGEIDFDRRTNRIPPDARIRATLRLPEQDTGLLLALRPWLRRSFPALLSFDIDGRLSGSITYAGSLTEWSDPQKALSAGSILPDLRGDLRLQASRIRYADMRTILTEVDANLRFTGDRLVVGRSSGSDRPFIATMAVLDPKTGKPDPTRKSDPIEASGELPLRPDVPNVSPLRLTAHRLVFAESILPGFGSGAAAGEISAPPAPGRKESTDPGLSLTFENTLLRPRISGAIHLRKTAIRLPNALDESAVALPVGLLQPSFANVKLQVDDQVRIATSAVALQVRTPAQQPIVLSGDIARPRLEGTLAVDQGILAFPTSRFQIKRGGRVEVRYPVYTSLALDSRGAQSRGASSDASLTDASLGIVVDLTAVGQVTATSAATGRPRRYTITVEARGPLNSGGPIDVTDAGGSYSGNDAQRALKLTFRSDPPDLALTSSGLQRKVTGVLGGQDAIEGLFRSDPRVARIFGDQVLGVVSANVLPDLFDRVGLTEALGLQELALDYNQLDQFSIRLSRRLAGPFDISFWHRFGAGRLTTTSERGLWEAKLSLRLGRGAQVSWTTDDQRTNAYLLEGVYRF